MLRNVIIKRIYESLELNGFFRVDDFTVTQQEINNPLFGGPMGERVFIQYTYNTRYSFEMQFVNNDGIVEVTASPGEARMTESLKGTLNASLALLAEWTNRIQDELMAAPHVRAIQEHEEKIKVIEKAIAEVRDDYFNKTERDELVQRLDNLQAEFMNKLGQGDIDSQRLRDDIELLKTDIGRLKQQVELLSKRQWLRSCLSRATTWIENHPKTIGVAGMAITHLLPDDVKSAIHVEEITKALGDDSQATLYISDGAGN